jgi:hypothetical protein
MIKVINAKAAEMAPYIFTEERSRLVTGSHLKTNKSKN